VRLTFTDEQVRASVGNRPGPVCTASGTDVSVALRALADEIDQRQYLKVWLPRAAKQYSEDGVPKADCPECGYVITLMEGECVIAFVCDACSCGVDVEQDEATSRNGELPAGDSIGEQDPFPLPIDRCPIFWSTRAPAAVSSVAALIRPHGLPEKPHTTLRCNECDAVVGTISTGILIDLVTLALATEMDRFVPDADHINALPGHLRK
jgi:hypothetical protein